MNLWVSNKKILKKKSIFFYDVLNIAFFSGLPTDYLYSLGHRIAIEQVQTSEGQRMFILSAELLGPHRPVLTHHTKYREMETLCTIINTFPNWMVICYGQS